MFEFSKTELIVGCSNSLPSHHRTSPRTLPWRSLGGRGNPCPTYVSEYLESRKSCQRGEFFWNVEDALFLRPLQRNNHSQTGYWRDWAHCRNHTIFIPRALLGVRGSCLFESRCHVRPNPHLMDPPTFPVVDVSHAHDPLDTTIDTCTSRALASYS